MDGIENLAVSYMQDALYEMLRELQLSHKEMRNILVEMKAPLILVSWLSKQGLLGADRMEAYSYTIQAAIDDAKRECWYEILE